ncbi:MAG: energy transducer TonB [Caulobacterales bacterium]|nr:energy transducer TonB [Caulobacterales bacterium]
MSAPPRRGLDPSLGQVRSPAPPVALWAAGLALASAAHIAGAAPYLVAPEGPASAAAVESAPIGVDLAPMIAPPPEPDTPPEPEPEEEPEAEEPDEPVIEERAEDSPPPAPPAEPRPAPDLPDIRPREIPEMWLGGGGGAREGGLTLEEFLSLEQWLAEARGVFLERLSYPIEARKRAMAGSAQVVVTCQNTGRVLDFQLAKRTGHEVLDQEIERAFSRVRRLPRFPGHVTHERLSFTLPVRFELMFEGRVMDSGDASPGGEAAPSAAPSDVGLPAAALSACAAQAAGLGAARDAITGRRAELEAARQAVESEARRYQRSGRDAPTRVRRRLERYNDDVAAFDADVAAFQAQADGYAAACGGGSAGWESFRLACGPYAAAGNLYCEAYGDLWARLQAAP